MREKTDITLRVNNTEYFVSILPYDTLNKVLRVNLGLTGTKRACDYGGCGSCTVLVDGEPVYSCMVPAMRVTNSSVTTIEGLARDGTLDPVQQAFVEDGAIQCGFCTPGLVLSAISLLDKNPNPTTKQILQAISGNICRCTGYSKIIRAIHDAAKMKVAAADQQRGI